MFGLLRRLPPNGPGSMADDPARIVVFGDVIDDVIATPSGAIRPDTDTPAAIERRGGGSAANTATWLATLGLAVDFVGRVGVLDLERHTRVLREAGVRAMLAGDHTLPTGTIVIIVDGDKRSMLTERGANAALDPDSVSDAILDGASALHFTGYSLFGKTDTSGFTRLIKRARSRGVHVSVDAGSAGFLADFGAKRFLSAIAGVDLLFPSLDEGRALTDLEDPAAIAQKLARKFPLVALTLGTGGIVLAGGGEVEHIEVTPATTVDPTGAGDAFCAGFLGEWIHSHDRRASADAGAELAARAVGVIGGRPPV
jgi:sugar/nucleoside kinase (ribokinase family)